MPPKVFIPVLLIAGIIMAAVTVPLGHFVDLPKYIGEAGAGFLYIGLDGIILVMALNIGYSWSYKRRR